METYNLTFLSTKLEQQYQETNIRSNIGVFKINLFFYSLIASVIMIFAFLQGRIIVAVLACVYVSQAPLIFYFAKKSNRNFDFFCFAFQVALSFSGQLPVVFNQVSGLILGADSYMIGQAVTYISLSQNMGTRFYLKVISIFINIIVQLIMKFVWGEETSPALTMYWIVSNFMIINYIYWQDRLKREAFQTKHNEKLWQAHFGTFAQVGILSCTSDGGQLQLDVNKCNKTSQEQFLITDLYSYKQFLQNVTLVLKKQFTQQIFNNKIKSKQCKNLYSWIHKFSQLTQLRSLDFVGQYQKILYDIKIFTTWNEQLLNIHMLITKSSLQTDSEELQLIRIERKFCADTRLKFTNQLKNILTELQCSKNQHSGVEKLICLVYDAMRVNFNLKLFMNPSHTPNLSHFFLHPLMKILNTVVEESMPRPHKLNIKCSVDPMIKLHSCQKTLFHILYNLYSIILVDAQQSGYIKVDTYEQDTQVGKCIMFFITTNIKSAQNLMSGQDYLKTISRKSIDFETFSNQSNRLELLVSECLLGQIGPQRRIKFNQSFSSRPLLSFNIFQNLSVLD